MTTYTLGDLSVSAIELLRYCKIRQDARMKGVGDNWMLWQMPSFAMEQLIEAGLIENVAKSPQYTATYGPVDRWRLTQLGEAYLKMIG